MTEEHVFDLIPGYSLGILDADESARVEAHLAVCERCQRELQGYRKVVDDLPLAMKISQPPSALKDRIMAQAGPARGAEPKIEESNFLDRLRKSFSLHPSAWGMAAVLLLLVFLTSNLLLWGQVNRLQSQEAQNLITVALQGSENAPDATGLLVMSEDGEYGVLVVDRLPELSSLEQYQLWLIHDGQRTSGGVFSVNEEGYGNLTIESQASLLDYNAFGITVEPMGGSSGPTGINVLGGEF